MKSRFVPSITHPCNQDWRNMSGDDKSRFCAQCQLHVHNLSAMSAPEQEAVLGNRKERQCVAYVDDGNKIKVHRNTWLMIQRLMRPWRMAATVVAAAFPMLFSSCASPISGSRTLGRVSTSAPPAKEDCKQVYRVNEVDGKMTSGVVAPLPSRWERIFFFWRR